MKNCIVWLFLLYIAYLDWKSYYVSPIFMGISFLLLAFYPWDWFSFFIFFVPVFWLRRFRMDWLGSADVFYIGLFALLLGVERMVVCMLVAIGVGFLFLLVFKKRMVPFVSCLVIGFLVALYRGYTIYGILMIWK